MKVLVTGAAGFIGFHLVQKLVQEGKEVIGLDNLNDYYDLDLKFSRLKEAGIDPQNIPDGIPVQSSMFRNYRFVRADITDGVFMSNMFGEERFNAVCHLAAQAGVRYSISHPEAYIQSNISGFFNILELCRRFPVKHLVFASSSSVYGLNDKQPFSETDQVDSPVSLYAASKKSNELMAHAYSHLYQIPTTGLRFFTVYGPWGRPDMAPMLFMQSILNQKPIRVFNYGKLSRDFTYIDDIVTGLDVVLHHPPVLPEPYKIYNIGNGQPVELLDFIESIEQVTGKKAVKNMVEMQPGDVLSTYADTSALERDFGFRSETELKEGISRLYDWYAEYYRISPVICE
jgi:UDP-glucuronate 4-epimerase